MKRRGKLLVSHERRGAPGMDRSHSRVRAARGRLRDYRAAADPQNPESSTEVPTTAVYS